MSIINKSVGKPPISIGGSFLGFLCVSDTTDFYVSKCHSERIKIGKTIILVSYFEIMYINECDIRLSKPRLDCVFIRLFNFLDSPNQYAQCSNPFNTQGCTVIDITYLASPFEFRVSCHSCKYFKSVNQLSLFD